MIGAISIPIPDLSLGPLAPSTLVQVLPHEAFSGWFGWRVQRTVRVPVWNQVLAPDLLAVERNSGPHQALPCCEIGRFARPPSRDSLLLPDTALKHPHQAITGRITRRNMLLVLPVWTANLCPSRHSMLLLALPHEAFTCRHKARPGLSACAVGSQRARNRHLPPGVTEPLLPHEAKSSKQAGGVVHVQLPSWNTDLCPTAISRFETPHEAWAGRDSGLRVVQVWLPMRHRRLAPRSPIRAGRQLPAQAKAGSSLAGAMKAAQASRSSHLDPTLCQMLVEESHISSLRRNREG
mmetsp:Transcript_64862/g.152489  ORF Transcript_64862/g.152489 Transcript_64862/m.152489 type:complete len:293 (+) Transcript_64862:556-1434(+)